MNAIVLSTITDAGPDLLASLFGKPFTPEEEKDYAAAQALSVERALAAERALLVYRAAVAEQQAAYNAREVCRAVSAEWRFGSVMAALGKHAAAQVSAAIYKSRDTAEARFERAYAVRTIAARALVSYLTKERDYLMQLVFWDIDSEDEGNCDYGDGADLDVWHADEVQAFAAGAYADLVATAEAAVGT